MDKIKQQQTPLAQALAAYAQKRILSFDVPGHKQGKNAPELTSFFGASCLKIDVNSMKPLDNLANPVSVIKESEELAADAFSAQQAFFLVNGTSSGILAMILYGVGRGEKIILPRNVHQSAINALIINGAIPIYINPRLDKYLGIPLGLSVEDLQRTIKAHPDAKAVLFNNPTYYGICSPLKALIELCHQNDMLALVDEAHGTHFYFHDDLPQAAMSLGADLSAVSMHKTGGALTQSSLLLANKSVNASYLRQIINLTASTSPSYLLMSSLDITRSKLALEGAQIFEKVMKLAQYARTEINNITNYYAFGPELINNLDVFAFDLTKLPIHTLKQGLAGIEVYNILRDQYNIQIELGDLANILAIISVGDSELGLERLISALTEIKRLHGNQKISNLITEEFIPAIVCLEPQKAFFAPKRSLPLENCTGEIASEFVMMYPPGIPILAPGEKITTSIIESILYSKAKGSKIVGPEDKNLEYLNVVGGSL